MSIFFVLLSPGEKVQIKAQRDIAATWALAGFASAKVSSALGPPWVFIGGGPKHFGSGNFWLCGSVRPEAEGTARLWHCSGSLRPQNTRMSRFAEKSTFPCAKSTFPHIFGKSWKKYLWHKERYFFQQTATYVCFGGPNPLKNNSSLKPDSDP